MTAVTTYAMQAFLRGDLDAIRPSALVLHHVAAFHFKVSLAASDGQELVTIAESPVAVGEKMTICDVHRAFEVTVHGGVAGHGVIGHTGRPGFDPVGRWPGGVGGGGSLPKTIDVPAIADRVVVEWNAAGKLPLMAWDFRALVEAGIRAALAEM